MIKGLNRTLYSALAGLARQNIFFIKLLPLSRIY